MMLDMYHFNDISLVSPAEPVNSMMMKHAPTNIELFEFNLGHAPQLHCASVEKSSCECESCVVMGKIRAIKQWFPRLGDHSRRRFMLGLMQRAHSSDLLQQIIKLLQPLLCKDFTYSRSRTNPSLSTDFSTLSCDHTLSQKKVETYIVKNWQWYKDANYWSKCNFALGLFQMCDCHLLHTIGAHARTLLISEMRAAKECEEGVYTEDSSIASSSYTFKSENYPDLEFLTTVSQQYGQETINPFTGKVFHGLDSGDNIKNDTQDEDFSEDTSESSFDLTLMVIPTSARAYAGISKYVDFIRLLPVHISKMILNLLDKESLMSASGVNLAWSILVEEVQRDIHVNQQLCHEIMMMQLGNKNLFGYRITAHASHGEVKLMDNYELAEAYSWDMASTLKLVKLEMNMKLRELNDRILQVIHEHSSEIENYENFHRDIFRKSYDHEPSDLEHIPEVEVGETKIEEHRYEDDRVEVLDQMKDKEVDYLDIIMPNLSHILPKIEQDGAHKKVQFSVKTSGISALGSSPVYAKDIDVLVPNTDPQTGHVVRTSETVIKTTFKSEVNFETAYSGVSTRNVIMEERNVFCGPYNVLVLYNQRDAHRVFHTDGGKLAAIGSRDRKVRFVDSTSGHEHKRTTKGENVNELPVITGHAGSIRCLYIVEKKGVVFSGSYDTSIRMWHINTGYCLKIFRGHRDTVLTIKILEDLLISGSRDRSCKVWDLQTGKCQCTFKHHHPVTAVAMSADVVITGCEGGKVKVWELKSGSLIKALHGHHETVTEIRFDHYHIVTGSMDGYALVWSAVGDHNRCLSALRHPKAVLCLEFMYLRCITGSADGRIRIWNIINGQCCRIIRGNSRSDPILDITCIDNRITLNTVVNLLVLNFEPIVWDYNLEEDKVPPLVQYSSYSDAPVRHQPYPYIRAQRMKRAGATNTKILHPDPSAEGKPQLSQMSYRAPQLPQSAKLLSAKRLGSARLVQQAPVLAKMDLHQQDLSIKNFGSVRQVPLSGKMDLHQQNHSRYDHSSATDRTQSKKLSATSKRPLSAAFKSTLSEHFKSRPPTSKSGQSAYSVTIVNKSFDEELNKQKCQEPLQIHRRVSWAFEHPTVPHSAKELSLSEMKALLRSQMRMKSESIVPPDFIYLTVNAIQTSMKSTETSVNTELNLRSSNISLDTRLRTNRPSSSPGKIDSRSRILVSEMDLSQFRESKESDIASEVSDWRSVKSTKSKDSAPVTCEKEIYSTKCEVREIKTMSTVSVHPKHVCTTLPTGRVIRPISASVTRREPLEHTKTERPITAPARRRPDTTSSIPSQIAASMPGMHPPRQKQHNITSTSYNVNIVPMLMYPPNMKEKLKTLLKEKRQLLHDDVIESASQIGFGKVSQYNDPMRSHVKFELKTHNQEQEYITLTEKQHQEKRMKEDAVLERKKRLLWTAKAKGKDL